MPSVCRSNKLTFKYGFGVNIKWGFSDATDLSYIMVAMFWHFGNFFLNFILILTFLRLIFSDYVCGKIIVIILLNIEYIATHKRIEQYQMEKMNEWSKMRIEKQKNWLSIVTDERQNVVTRDINFNIGDGRQYGINNNNIYTTFSSIVVVWSIDLKLLMWTVDIWVKMYVTHGKESKLW